MSLHRNGASSRPSALTLGALGVVFGDIGTSPLYALQTVFSLDGGVVKATPEDVYGVISMVFWSLLLIVTVKYVLLILRADNQGEGGVLALAALARRSLPSKGKQVGLVMLLGVLGASLFYGDSVITPAISVMSAIEGLSVTEPGLAELVVPLGVAIITALFLVQRHGTHRVGRLFGPVMLLWFATLAVLGLHELRLEPSILKALSPTFAFALAVQHPFIAFVAMGAVVLSITGAEALYADMGHFGRVPIRRAWLFVVFPSLVLNYLGQGALILRDPSAATSPFFHLAPSWAQLPLVALATAATIIASQSVISGAYSVSRQAERLGYLPRLTVRHTSEHEGGQIYIPSINWILYAGVIILLVVFQSSEHLATAYGLAVTGTFLITTALFLIYAQAVWRWSTWQLVGMGVLVGWLELTYFGANLTKVLHGGWLPLLIALIVATTMLTWQRGRSMLTKHRLDVEGPIEQFREWIQREQPTRVAGTAIFLHPSKETTPLALLGNATFNHVLHEDVFIVSAISENVPHVPDEERVKVDDLGDPHDHLAYLELHFGFSDDQDVPRALRLAQEQGVPIDPDEAYYFISRIGVQHGKGPGLSRWRKRLFVWLSHNSANPSEYFRLPRRRTIVMGAQIRI